MIFLVSCQSMTWKSLMLIVEALCFVSLSVDTCLHDNADNSVFVMPMILLKIDTNNKFDNSSLTIIKLFGLAVSIIAWALAFHGAGESGGSDLLDSQICYMVTNSMKVLCPR